MNCPECEAVMHTDSKDTVSCISCGYHESSTTKRTTTNRKSGGSTHYYELPPGATELRHLIRHKQMSHPIGELFCAAYRLNDNGEKKRNLEKIVFYAQAELEYLADE